MSDLQSAIEFLTSQSGLSLPLLFWYSIVFDIPRYAIVFVSLAVAELFERRAPCAAAPDIDWSRVSVIVVGHNEADVLERCVRSLREQSVDGFEIVIVSDGSTDAMASKAQNLVRTGLADCALCTDLRGGKPAGTNLAVVAAKGEIIVQVDCDCSFDRFAIERIVAPFADRSVGAASGDIVVRNANESLIARFQFIEYLLAISVGKRFDNALGLVKCVSGAFGAFRRSALDEVGGVHAGSGEDFDLTLRLREAGWRIVFVGDAIGFTDVPTTLWALFRQRLRWEGDAVGLRYRKHRGLMGPRSSRFNAIETLHQWEFLFLNVFGALLLPIYLIWLFALLGSAAIVVLLAMELAFCLLNVVLLLLASMITKRHLFFSNLLYVPGFTVFNSVVMRVIRAVAYIEEWFRFRSSRDNYAPSKVRALIRW